MKDNFPRAYYTGGFSVGARVFRVAIIGKIDNEASWLCKVTSKTGRGYAYGDQLELMTGDLWDRCHTTTGLRLTMIGRAWSTLVGDLPTYHKVTDYRNMRYRFELA